VQFSGDKSPSSGARSPSDGNHLFPVTGTSPHGHRRNGATLCPACKIAPTRSSFVRLPVKSGRFVCSGLISGPERRRRWSEKQKRALVAAAFAPGAIVSEVARRADV
jgi:Transposase